MVTAPGDAEDVDFVSRFFAPGAGSRRIRLRGLPTARSRPTGQPVLGKTDLTARQRSARGGALRCVVEDERVLLMGRAILTMVGKPLPLTARPAYPRAMRLAALFVAVLVCGCGISFRSGDDGEGGATPAPTTSSSGGSGTGGDAAEGGTDTTGPGGAPTGSGGSTTEAAEKGLAVPALPDPSARRRSRKRSTRVANGTATSTMAPANVSFLRR